MVPISEMKSPGVFIQEVDLSTYVAVMNTSKIFGIVTVAQNGPIGEVVSIASVKEFEKVFGNPISAGGLACVRILDQTSSLKVVRAAGSSASARTLTIKGTDSEDQAVNNAVIISYKYKGTLYSDALKVSISSILGQSDDKFNLLITKGDDNEELLNKNYTIIQANATDEFPYLIADTDTDFVFALGSTATLKSLATTTAEAMSVGDNGTTLTDEQIRDTIDAFDDAENIDLDILAAPGMYSSAAIARLVTVANNRKDIVSIIDPPTGLTPEQMVEFVNGTSSSYPIAKLDTTYAATYYPWGKGYNEYSGVNEWLPPTVGILPAMAAEYSVYENWTAPAGIPRLSIAVFSEMEKILARPDRDILYENHVNPIVNYKGQGLTAFGQKTLQRKLSATDRLNVRFLVNYIKKFADYASTAFLFSEINENTFDSWTQAIDKELSNIKNRGGLYDYKITMDWTTVTDEYLNNNIMPGIIQIKPTKTCEFIPIDVVIRNKSDEFD